MEKEEKFKTIAIIGIVVGVVILAGLFYMDKKGRSKAFASLSTEEADKEKKLSELELKLDKEDASLQDQITQKENGDPMVITLVSGIDESLYTTIYPQMNERGYKGLFTLTDGIAPGEREGEITADQWNEMTGNGWNYAFAVSMDLSNENQGEWLQALDASIAQWAEKGIANPGILVCVNGQVCDNIKEELVNRGIHFVLSPKTEEIGLIGTYEEEWHRIDSVRLTEADKKTTNLMKSAAKSNRSLSVTLSKVTDTAQAQIQDSAMELSTEKFTSFLDELNGMAEKGYRITSFNEYLETRRNNNAECDALKQQYEAFQNEKEEKINQIKSEK